MRAFPKLVLNKRYFLSYGGVRLFVYNPVRPMLDAYYIENKIRMAQMYTLDQMDERMCNGLPRGREISEEQARILMGAGFDKII